MFDQPRGEDRSGRSGPQGLPENDNPDPEGLGRLARAALEQGVAADDHAPAAAPESERALDDPRTLAAVLRSAPEGIVLFDRAATIADWSPAAERILGYRRNRVVGRDLLELIFPERLRPAMRGVLESRGAGWGDAAQRAIEVSLRHSSGEEIPIELSLSWASGSALFAAHLRDGRERGDRERELAAEARRRNRLIDLGQTALSARDLDRLMARALRAVNEEIGLTSSEIWEQNEPQGELTLRAACGDSVVLGARVTAPAGSRVAELLRSNEPGVVTGDKLMPSPWQAPEDFREGTPPGIAATLPGVDAPLGVISGSTYEGGGFTTADTTFLESVALIVAEAVERDRFDHSRERAESRLRNLVERLPAVTYRAGLGEAGRWHYISPQVEEILGYSPAECLADRFWWEKCMQDEDVERVLAVEEDLLRDGGELDIEYRLRARDGRMLWVRDRATITATGEGGETIAEGLLFDITAQKEAEARLRHLADHDHLTGLLNRRGFESAVDGWLGACGPSSRGVLAIIDLDHLKRVNDSLGHAVGDALLREIAATIRVSLRGDDVLGRLSGDEFGLFMPEIGEVAAKRRLEELIQMIRESGANPQITASAGAIAVDGSHQQRAADLLVHADMAMYQAKERGRDRVAFSDNSQKERLQWVSEIREAIDAGRLALYAQPIVDLKTREHYAYELLVRMIDRNGEPVAASQFIPAAERFGLIRRLDHWVVARALEVAASGLRVSVNLSAGSIADAELTDLVAERLQAGDLDPALITFEITETVATPTIELLREFAERVERLGCGLSLDDVGTGFGTLTYLQNLRFSQLKIDMGFVRGILDSGTDAGIVRSLVVIARELGLSTVAEGVEQPQIADELHALGVDCAQGYHLGEPVPVETILER